MKGEYQEGATYQRLNQVTMLGSTYQSKIDGNTSAPAQMGADGAVENINTEKWLCIAVGNISFAKKVVYNNETSGLEAGNVQAAIDETNTKIDLIGCYKYTSHLSLKGTKEVKLPFNYEVGQPITFKVSNYSVEAPEATKHNVAIYSGDKVLMVLYSNGEKTVIINEGTDSLKLKLGYVGEMTSFDADVEVLYGAMSSIDTKFNDNTSAINSTNNAVEAINLTTNAELKSLFLKGTLTDFNYSRSVYIGLDVPFESDCVLNTFAINLFQASSKHIGDIFEFIIGTIDQRNWLLPRLSFMSPISQIKDGNVWFNFKDNRIVAKKGEVLFVKLHGLSESSDALCGLSNDTYNKNRIVRYTKDLNTELRSYDDKGFSYFDLSYANINSIFSYKENTENLEQTVANILSQISNNKIYIDDVTNKKYQLKVSKGSIVLQSINIEKMLVIGHSFVTYGNSPSIDWYLDDGENRAMAPSINAHQWTEFIKSKLNCSVDIKSGVNFERNYSVSYNFASNWNVQDNYDAICVYLGENEI